MSYATAAQLRERYWRGTVDEFAARPDTDLEAALEAASVEIDRWRPQGPLGSAATDVLVGVCLTLARMLVHQDHALDPAHPIVRDGVDARSWLRALADGRVHLPSDDTSQPAAAPRVDAPAPAFGADFARRYA